MNIKELAKQEYCDLIKRRAIESGGTHIIYYLGLVFSIFYSSLYGFHYDKGEVYILIILTLFTYLIYLALTNSLAYVKENGKIVNIFSKYKYTPMDIKMLKKAKMLVLIRILGLPVLLSQLVSLFVILINPDNEGARILEITVWIPMILGIVYIISKYFEFEGLSRR